jgi:uncharacterized membrane protein
VARAASGTTYELVDSIPAGRAGDASGATNAGTATEPEYRPGISVDHALPGGALVEQYAPLFLTIHILTAIGAFGPTFIFPLIARMSAQDPQSGLFALRLTDRIEKRVVIPGALTMPISGGLLVWSEGIDLLGTHWLLLAIALYIVAISYSIAIQMSTIDRMIEVAGAMAAGRGVLAEGPGAALARPVPDAAVVAAEAVDRPRYAGPAAEMAALGARARNGGVLLTILVVTIVALMSAKPGF